MGKAVDGKRDGQMDDLSDSWHMTWWIHYIEIAREAIPMYDEQIKEFSNELEYI